jgi:ribosomal protein L7Ae-like RNA K-turn-binding protein
MRGALARALRGVAQVEPESIERMIIQQLDRRVRGLLSSALRVRSVAVGTDAVRGVLLANQGDLLVVARDARGRAGEITKMATSIGCATVTWGTKASLGEVFSRQELGVFLVTDRGIASAILECLAQTGALSEDE